MSFKEIHASGSNYNLGFTHGSLAKEKVAGTIYYYKQKFEKIWGCPWDKIKEFSNQYYHVIQSNFPQYLDELRGISDGSDMPFDDILAINCHYEIARKGGISEHSCSVIGVNCTRSADGNSYIAENWDYAVFQKNNSIILKLTLDNNSKICMVTEAGIIGRMGFNSNGIGYCGNTLKNDDVGFKLPLHIVKRLILEQRSLSDVRNVIHHYGVASSFNILAGSHNEGFCDFEVDYRQITELAPKNGLLLHTNNFISPHLNVDNKYTKYQKEESVLRYQSLEKSLSRLIKISVNDIRKALAQHTNHPYGVCTHADENTPAEQQWATICSLIINLPDQLMYVCEGNPCESKYTMVRLS